MNKIMNFYKHNDMADHERRQARTAFIAIIGDKFAQVELCEYLTTLKNKVVSYESIDYARYQRKLQHVRMMSEHEHILKIDGRWTTGMVGVVLVDEKYKWLEVPTSKVDGVITVAPTTKS